MSTDDSFQMPSTTEDHRPLNEYWRQRQRLGAAMRELGSLLSSREISETSIAKLTQEVETINTELRPLAALGGRKGWCDAGLGGDLDKMAHEISPLIGKSSMVGPGLKIWLENGEGRARVHCDWRFEGPPLCLHGGYVAALFDEFLGWVQMFSGGAGATKNLSVTYHKPTPLNVDLELKARLVSVEGRKIKVVGEMYAGDVMTASAEGLFISFGHLGTRELYKNMA